MSEVSKTYRIRTVVGTDNKDYTSNLNILLDQKYDTFEIMSLKISSSDSYKLHNSNYGVVAGRVIANNGFGIPNAKISVFIEADSNDNIEMSNIYPYSSISVKNNEGYRYNLLPDNKVDNCHQIVGSFPNKSYLLDNDILLEVFDKYYKFTTRTNNSGDYIMCGIPTGTHTLHMDLDLSDCGILSQRPRDFVYKGYTIEQFENPNQFKSSTNLNSLSQIFSQDQVITVNPFWGNSELGETIGITRTDINVAFKFEPTCIFMGSIVSDNSSNGITKNCVPTNQMGQMEEMVTGEGTIEMIRKTPEGNVESFQVKGGQVINADGIWCYQIPMNLDYMMTDEYGNMVPTDDPEKGIPTRARVRFRISMQDMEGNTDMYYRAKVLVPHNPQNTENGHEEYDYDFGTYTNEESFRDLFWNNVYTVKSYIPRISKSTRWKSEKFTGIKGCNHYGQNNPMPYNNIRIKLPLMFTLLCVLIKSYIWIISAYNTIVTRLYSLLFDILFIKPFGFYIFNEEQRSKATEGRLSILEEGLCPDLENWYFAPVSKSTTVKWTKPNGDVFDILGWTYNDLVYNNEDTVVEDKTSIDYNNRTNDKVCLTTDISYLVNCIEMNLAQEYKVINFDFYNDWLNGVIYIPRWMRYIKIKRQYFIFGHKIEKVKGCMADSSIFSKSRKYMQLCSLGYNMTINSGSKAKTYTKVNYDSTKNYHKNSGKAIVKIFGKSNGGIVHEGKTFLGQNVYYLKPCEWDNESSASKKVILFATDIVLLGSLNDCDINGTPNIFTYLSSSTYKMPTNLALTNMDTDGALYGTTNGTICNESVLGDNLTTVDNNSLSSEINYYNNGEINPTNVPEPMTYANNGNGLEESDTIAITEAAGISWDYNGPYQGASTITGLYFPGGHFLGLSCVNSETTIKSCVNLTRICELGVTMSQRKEIVRKIESDNNGSNVLYRYKYNIPTGLIGGDEIVSVDARSIFATMNSNRLIATKKSEQTGYKYYDFNFLYPNRFNGEMEDIVNSYSGYNTKVEVKDEDLTKYGIMLSKDRSDFIPDENHPDESEEVYNTQRRTMETNSIDYYMFRMGLPFKYINASSNSLMQNRKYLINNGNIMKLPQYENSFYFYFGLHDGATALDEFNKEFFSTCDNESILNEIVDVRITSEYNICNGGADITANIEGMTSPYSIKIYKNENGKWVEDTNLQKEEYVDNSYTFFAEFGSYKIEVKDNDESFISKSFTVNDNIATADISAYDFNSSADTQVEQWYYGGYFTIDNLRIGDVIVNNKNFNAKDVEIIIGDESPIKYIEHNNIYHVKKSGTFNIKVKYRCRISDYHTVSLGTYTIKNTSNISLTIGKNNEIEVVGNSYPNSYDLNEIDWTKKAWYYDIESSLKNPELIWLIKHLTFEQNGYVESSITFNSYVQSNNNKALFGWAQEYEKGWIKDKVWSSFDSSNGLIVEGALTDASQSYKVINSATTAEFFGAMSYDNNAVGGNFIGVISGATGDYASGVTLQMIFGNIDDFIGVMLKSSDGEVEMAKVMENGIIKFNEPKENYYGVIYPLFRYPSVYRPFYCNANYFEYILKNIESVIDNSGFENIEVVYNAKECKIEGEIYNGITYNNKFGTGSTINGQSIENIVVTENDMQNISSSNRVVPFNMMGLVDNGLSYSILEGTPDKFAASAVTINSPSSNEAIFYDNVYFSQFNGGVKFNGIGTTSTYVKYYIIKNNSIFTTENKAIIYANSQFDGYILGYYKAGIRSGESIPIKVFQNTITYTEYNDDGSSLLVALESDSPIDLNDASASYIAINNILNNNNKADIIEIDKQKTMNTNSSWSNLILSQIQNGGNAIEIQMDLDTNIGIYPYAFDENEDTFIGVFKSNEMDENAKNLSTLNILRIYPYISETKSSEQYVGYVTATDSTINFSRKGDTKTLLVKSNTSWRIDFEDEVTENSESGETSAITQWYSCDSTGGTGDKTISITVDSAEDFAFTSRKVTMVISTLDNKSTFKVLINQRQWI